MNTESRPSRLKLMTEKSDDEMLRQKVARSGQILPCPALPIVDYHHGLLGLLEVDLVGLLGRAT